MTDQAQKPETLPEKAARMRVIIDKEVDTLAALFGLKNSQGKLDGDAPRKSSFKFLKHVVSGFYGINDRLTQLARETLRAAGAANHASNIGQIHLKMFVELGEENGWWKDSDEFSVMFNSAASELQAEARAKMEAGDMDPVQKHVGDLIKVNKQEVGDRLHADEEDKEIEDDG